MVGHMANDQWIGPKPSEMRERRASEIVRFCAFDTSGSQRRAQRPVQIVYEQGPDATRAHEKQPAVVTFKLVGSCTGHQSGHDRASLAHKRHGVRAFVLRPCSWNDPRVAIEIDFALAHTYDFARPLPSQQNKPKRVALGGWQRIEMRRDRSDFSC